MVIVSSIEELGYIQRLQEPTEELLNNLVDQFISKFGVDFFSSAFTIIILCNDNFFHVIKSSSNRPIPYEPICNLSTFVQS